MGVMDGIAYLVKSEKSFELQGSELGLENAYVNYSKPGK